MSKLARVNQKQFGVTGPAGDFGQFGSKKLNAQIFTQDPTIIQALAAFQNGWGDAILGNYEPPMEDMNSLFFLIFRQIAYMFQEGISEWETGTTYFIGSITKVNGAIYRSLSDNNSGNNPVTDSANWEKGLGGANGGVPVGAILPWGGDITDIPSGYLYGDGSAVDRTTYAALFAKYGTKYGAGNGTTTFNLPNGRGKNLIGLDGSSDFNKQGDVGGEKSHILTVAEMPSHVHPLNTYKPVDQTNNLGQGDPGVGFNRTLLTGSTGGDQPHNNLQPYQVIGGCIVKF